MTARGRAARGHGGVPGAELLPGVAALRCSSLAAIPGGGGGGGLPPGLVEGSRAGVAQWH